MIQPLQQLFVFDIETVPDTDAVRNLTGCQSEDVAVLRQSLTDYHLEVTKGKNTFPRQMFHKIVAISFLEADIYHDGQHEWYEFKQLRSGGKVGASEQELVQGFFQHLGKVSARLVSFNGRGFDLPVLKYRAMVHGVQADWLYKRGDKWNNYTQRYSLDWHCDLLEALSDYGSSTRCKLNEVCAVLKFPGKVGIDGSKVQDMYDDGEIQAIRDYCETDVLNTYLVYLRYKLLDGTLSSVHYDQAIRGILAFLEDNKAMKHFNEFIEVWREISTELPTATLAS